LHEDNYEFLFNWKTLIQVEVANCPSATTRWNRFTSQKSTSIPLVKGKAVYLQALQADYALSHFVSIGTSMENVHHSSSKIGGAVDEKQSIATSSVALCDKQVQ
jgi:hypothetical protein